MKRTNPKAETMWRMDEAARKVSFSALERICAIIDEDLKEPASC